MCKDKRDQETDSKSTSCILDFIYIKEISLMQEVD